jgi:lysozyme
VALSPQGGWQGRAPAISFAPRAASAIIMAEAFFMRTRVFLLPALLALCACSAQPADGPLGTAQEASVCASGATLQGVDVSVYDGTVDWAAAHASGVAFGIAKATEGAALTDSTFATNWAAMKQQGVIRGAYHFFHCDTDPATQASYFLGVMGALEPGDLPPALDFEDTTTCSASDGISLAVQWLDAVAQATGTLPFFYGGYGVVDGFDDTQALAGHAQLWVADYQVTCPTLPTPFTAWQIWQTTGNGTVPGLSNSNGNADVDEFNGDLAALKTLTVGGSGSGSGASSSSSSSGSSAPACTVDGVEGTCIDTSVCATMAGYVSTPGFCPGPADEQCCTPTAAATTSSSSGATSSAASASSGGTGGAVATGSGGAPTTSGGGNAGGGPSGTGASSGSTRGQSGGCSASRDPSDRSGQGAVLLALGCAACVARSRRRQRA